MADIAVAVQTENCQARSAWLKRAFDLAIACAGLVLASPIIVLIAILVKICDPAYPVIFKQKRIGLKGKPFTIYKFRTLRAIRHLCHKDQFAPIPFCGRFLRRWHLDELPQLINILRGEMSVVGPRPRTSYEIARLQNLFPQFEQRNFTDVKPGITGAGQIVYDHLNGPDMKKVFSADLQYIKNNNCFVDLKLLFQTLSRINKGA